MLNKIYLVFPVIRFFRIASILFWALFVQSCITEKRCNERFPPVRYDSIREYTTYTCDSFPIYIPYQEITFDTTGIISPSIIFHAEKKRGGLTAIINIRNGKLSAECKEDSLRRVIEYERENKVTDNIITEIREVKTNILTRFQSFLFVCGWLFWILMLLVIIWLAIYFSRK